MANAFRPQGLSPYKHLHGAPFNNQAQLYYIAPSDTNAYAIGDPVVSSGSGDSNGVPGITLAAATGAIRGVIVGLGTSEGLIANPNNLNQTIRPAGANASAYYAMVVDDPGVIFAVSEPGSGGTPLTAAAIGFNINLVVGTNNGYISGWTISNTGAATTATLQVKLLGLVRETTNAFGFGAQWLVLINNHELNAGTAGV
jgi:hypothetical protein